MDIKDLEALVKEITQKNWSDQQKPMLLSNLPAELKKMGLEDYREVLSGISLKSFVSDTAGQDNYKVVSDPRAKAKIGLIPPEAEYEFAVKSESASADLGVKGAAAKNSAVALLGILSKLSNEDLEKIDIPLSVLVSLYKKS
ncbi:hypothetical protein ACSMFQ_03340 [Ectopseudomonas chengduensis]|jgi:hypothetical protein|nr:hypothetical protein [Pseudomonas chengduensis]MDH1558245.1 hypothetical protein [Pseudomonas chengduensis]